MRDREIRLVACAMVRMRILLKRHRHHAAVAAILVALCLIFEIGHDETAGADVGHAVLICVAVAEAAILVGGVRRSPTRPRPQHHPASPPQADFALPFIAPLSGARAGPSRLQVFLR